MIEDEVLASAGNGCVVGRFDSLRHVCSFSVHPDPHLAPMKHDKDTLPPS